MNMAERFKAYENHAEHVLPSGHPVIIRLDGNSFSKLTDREEFDKPFDPQFEGSMNAAAIAVLEYCSGAKVAYCQSDEISILLDNNWLKGSEPFLGNRTQKIASLCASKASVAFNRANAEHRIDTEAVFDCRAFVVPEKEVNSYFAWRQQDAVRNCLHSFVFWKLADAYDRKTAHNMLHGKGLSEMKDLYLKEYGVNSIVFRRANEYGRCIYKENYEVALKDVMPSDKIEDLMAKGHVDDPDELVTRSRWKIDEEIPRFNENVNYIGKFLYFPP